MENILHIDSIVVYSLTDFARSIFTKYRHPVDFSFRKFSSAVRESMYLLLLTKKSHILNFVYFSTKFTLMTYFPTSILTLFNYSQDFLPLLVEPLKNDGLEKVSTSSSREFIWFRCIYFVAYMPQTFIIVPHIKY